ncbi:PREDICTED: myeloid differentiation primary response protein MyD88-like [Branchiostoma belcheri]|uniref:Myeloid differentiation primary response protein MyD88 n=1 Tax=Branchiostoma belcheri TaxID=7741 RepID=A0A6P4YPF9_BRABE|nr:PREDICTED: myeloid differentiation primary response protein MyD88-like [Branchiostoma belcheri]
MATNAPTQDTDGENYDSIPARYLGVQTRKKLALWLNPPRVGGTNWEDLADEMGFEYIEIENFKLNNSPMYEVLHIWSLKENATIGQLIQMLKHIERFDVLDEIQSSLAKDISKYRERSSSPMPVQVPEVSTGNYPNVPTTSELHGITLQDDPYGVDKELFDAYVCYCKEDRDFVIQMVEKLESSEFGRRLKLCIDDRDLLPGTAYLTVTAELIENRCKRMVVVLSPEFLDSPECDFQTKYAMSLSPGAKKQRLIPVMYKQIEVPQLLRFVTVIDYVKDELKTWFWHRLAKALSRPIKH